MTFTWSDIPQEILLLISEYGQVAPGLDCRLIDLRIRSISPDWRWGSQLRLEAMRRDNKFYRQMETLIEYCNFKDIWISEHWEKRSIIIYDLKNVIPEHILPDHPELRIYKKMILRDPIIIIEATYSHRDLMICPWLYDPRVRFKHNIPDNLGNPYNRDDLTISINSHKQSRLTSPEDMISEILRIQPKFNLGELIHRIELIKRLMIENTCPDTNEMMESLYSTCISRIIQQGLKTVHIEVIEGADYSEILRLFGHCHIDLFLRYKPNSPCKIRMTLVMEDKDELKRIVTSSGYIEAMMGRVLRKRVRWDVKDGYTNSCSTVIPGDPECRCNIM
uniref:F-box domain-containing protein n=1 Tax=viral metagenome TaxID=1070528 RepID=A0A6C0BM88_9ZZZZ